ncbi:MAG: hypothetical protein FWC72_05950 [Oscillospiraceae bacterium]|nr:hypothetical protein [Oscillospiraceae bacterium]
MNLSYEKKVLLSVLQKNPNIGKTAVMKAAFMLQQVKKLHLDYDFSIYTYGPYSSDVTEDVDDLISKRLAVSTVCDYGNYVGYDLNVSEEGKAYTEGLDRDSEKAVAEIVDFIKGKSVKDLELYSTIIYIEGLYTKNSWERQADSIVKQVHELKPHFGEDVIGSALKMLHANGCLAS